MPVCLLIEDEVMNRELLERLLSRRGYEIIAAADGKAALEACAGRRPEVVLLDLGLPDVEGLELIPELLKISPLSRIIVQTGLESVESAVAALRAGARHYLVKPFDYDQLLEVVRREANAVSFERLQESDLEGPMFWGSNHVMARLRNTIRKIAKSPFTPTLIEGETGSGKGVIAKELHARTCPSSPFVTLNCAAVPADLLESELFGHEKGAFTGAESRRRGLAELAQRGTLFLDEIADLPLPLQSKLLRFVEDRTLRRVGGEVEISVKCRIVAATLKNLEECVHEGRFREDLFYRLAVVRLMVPPLRERREDLLPLAHRLLEQIAKVAARPLKPLSPAAEDAVMTYEWPGNVRELRNRLERAVVLSEGAQIEAVDLDLVTAPVPAPVQETPELEDEPEMVRRALAAARWNVAKASRQLGVERHWLRYRIEKYGFRRPERRHVGRVADSSAKTTSGLVSENGDHYG